MKAKDFEKLGLEKILELHDYTKEDVIFIGRVYSLINANKITYVRESTLCSFDIGTKEEMTLDKCKKFFKKHGFPEPICAYENKTYSGDKIWYLDYNISNKRYTIRIKKTGEIKAL